MSGDSGWLGAACRVHNRLGLEAALAPRRPAGFVGGVTLGRRGCAADSLGQRRVSDTSQPRKAVLPGRRLPGEPPGSP